MPIPNTPPVPWRQTVSRVVVLLVRFSPLFLFLFHVLFHTLPTQTAFDSGKALEINPMIFATVSLILVAGVFPLFGLQMYNKLGYQWATSVLAFLTVAMMPFPYIFFRYGKQIRGRSRFAKGR